MKKKRHKKKENWRNGKNAQTRQTRTADHGLACDVPRCFFQKELRSGSRIMRQQIISSFPRLFGHPIHKGGSS